MSKRSPVPKNSLYKREVSPLSTNFDRNMSHHENTHYNRPSNAYTHIKHEPEENNYRLTEKKKQDKYGSYEMDNLLGRNNSLGKENTDLYQMLEERGKIITAL